MLEKDKITEHLKALQLGKAKVRVYKDLVAHLSKYCATLQRKINDANKKHERIGQRDKASDAYFSALNEALFLQTMLVEARDLHIEILERAVQLSDDLISKEKAFAEMAEHVLDEADKDSKTSSTV